MVKILIKSWVYHSLISIKKGNEPFSLDNFGYKLGMNTIIEYIELGLIDCSDLCGKENCIEIVRKWFS